MTLPPDKLWTVDDVADFCRVRPSVVQYWVRNTDIPAIRLGRQIRFDPQTIREWVEGQSRGIFPIRREPLKGLR